MGTMLRGMMAASVLALAGVASAIGGSPGGTANYSDTNGPFGGPNPGKPSHWQVLFGPCVNGQRAVTLVAGGNLTGELITKVVDPTRVRPCGARHRETVSWIVEVETTVSGPGGTLVSTTLRGFVSIDYLEPTGSGDVIISGTVQQPAPGGPTTTATLGGTASVSNGGQSIVLDPIEEYASNRPNDGPVHLIDVPAPGGS